MPYLKVVLPFGSQPVNTLVVFAQALRLSRSASPQSKYWSKHFTGLFSSLQTDFQQDVYRSTDNTYHAAPKTWKDKYGAVNQVWSTWTLRKENETQVIHQKWERKDFVCHLIV